MKRSPWLELQIQAYSNRKMDHAILLIQVAYRGDPNLVLNSHTLLVPHPKKIKTFIKQTPDLKFNKQL